MKRYPKTELFVFRLNANPAQTQVQQMFGVCRRILGTFYSRKKLKEDLIGEITNQF